MHLEISFCEHFCFQMTFWIPGTIGKCSWGKTSILDDVCANYEQLFHPVQCTDCRKCQCGSRDILALPKKTGISSFSDQLHYLWGKNYFGNSTRQYSTCLYQSGILHILFSYQYILSILGEIFLLCNQSLQCMAIAAFQLQSTEVFWEKWFEL